MVDGSRIGQAKLSFLKAQHHVLEYDKRMDIYDAVKKTQLYIFVKCI